MNESGNERGVVEEIFGLVSSGQFEHAERRCNDFLEKRPDDINVLGLLGMVLLRLGKTGDARSILEKTISLEPRFAKPHKDLGMLCLHEGNAEQAERHFNEAIRLDGNQASAYGGLAQALARLGRYDAARKAKEQHLQLSPITKALAKANKLRAAGQLAEAESICDEISKQHPANSDILRLQAKIASEDGRKIIAEGLLKRIIQISPDSSRPYAELGRFYGQNDRYPEAVDALRKSIELDSSVVGSHQLLADYLSILGHSEEALQSYDVALRLHPDYAPAMVGRGHMLRILGRWDDAITAYETAIEIHPNFGDAWWSLASLKRYRFSPEQIRQMHASLDASRDKVDSEISLHFALARSFEDDNDFDSAWRHYELGNSKKRSVIKYNSVRIEMSNDAVIDFFDHKLFKDRKLPDLDGPSPIFIVGMPRAGSTLLEQILASHSQVEGAAELPYIAMLSKSLGSRHSGEKRYPEVLADMTDEQIASIGKAYLYYSEENRPQKMPRFTDKMPSNFSYVGLIRLALPNAKIIDSRRHPLAACIANYRQLYAKGKNHAYNLIECAEYFLDYDRVMAHWDEVLPGQVLRVQYEDVINDVEAQVRRLLDFCELPWEDECLKFYKTDRPVNTASMEQVREPIYTDAVDYWKNYEVHLDEIKEVLAPVLDD
jgi:tetratricopeptide (TPR) repeat protein